MEKIPTDHEDDERQELSDRQGIDEHCALPDADDVDDHERRHQAREQHRTGRAHRHRRPVEAERRDEHVDDRRPARDAA